MSSWNDPDFPGLNFEPIIDSLPNFKYGMCKEAYNFPTAIQGRIVGGVLATSEGWPWFVKLNIQKMVVYMSRIYRREDWCGGTIIASNLILTGIFIKTTFLEHF